MHVYLDHDNCLETLVLKDPDNALRDLAQQLIAIKGVKHGRFYLTTAEQNLT
jgi:CopG family nickel-responsive transcriptional regulator